MGNSKDKFLKLVSDEKTDTLKKARHRIKYRWFYSIRNKIIIKYLILKDKINYSNEKV